MKKYFKRTITATIVSVICALLNLLSIFIPGITVPLYGYFGKTFSYFSLIEFTLKSYDLNEISTYFGMFVFLSGSFVILCALLKLVLSFFKHDYFKGINAYGLVALIGFIISLLLPTALSWETMTQSSTAYSDITAQPEIGFILIILTSIVGIVFSFFNMINIRYIPKIKFNELAQGMLKKDYPIKETATAYDEELKTDNSRDEFRTEISFTDPTGPLVSDDEITERLID